MGTVAYTMPTEINSLAELNKVNEEVMHIFAKELVTSGLSRHDTVELLKNFHNLNMYTAHFYHQLITEGKIPPALQYKMEKPRGK